MITQQPTVANVRYRGSNGRVELIGAICVLAYIQGLNAKVDFRKLESNGFDVKVED
jgi:hypothetical protein